ncbi:MAG: lipopolysaccharide assembly protein LapA domain-containing protein [Liquorilactobacillus ghanensis]
MRKDLVMKNQWRLISAIFLILIVAVFALLNTQKVKIDLLFWRPAFPLVLVIIMAVLLGALIAVLLSFVTIHQLKKEIKKLKINESNLEADYQEKYDKKLAKEQAGYQKKINELKSKIAKQQGERF